MSSPKDPIPDGLSHQQRVMAEEVLHKDPTVRILPTQDLPDKLPGIEDMVPYHHKACQKVAFYYTHRIKWGEMITASRARTAKGKPLEAGSSFKCTSCGAHMVGTDMFIKRSV